MQAPAWAHASPDVTEANNMLVAMSGFRQSCLFGLPFPSSPLPSRRHHARSSLGLALSMRTISSAWWIPCVSLTITSGQRVFRSV